ncbi:siphovirus Gp157 family protein [Paenibacillus sp. ISL-20]|uniref:siphovirus Gp157 family protein n=1 Tax=Paenibacillus sp. ISL-20 TaxID=2819163 RepID=UPI001BEB3D0A|nr:siphovirus Gp157 family protein [Paenibacillus sp. ISL-20]MBT2759937.1 siphovirus Gp157 family protein [Paenibacillus sp. ISL-20]
MKLYELTGMYKKFNDYANDILEDDMSEDEIQALIDNLESIDDLIENKCENTAKLMKNIEADIKALKDEEDRLAKRRKVLQNKHDGIKSYMQSMLESSGINSVNAGLFKVRLQANPPSLNVINPKLIPDTYKITQDPKIDTKSLLDAVKKGEVIEGVELVKDKKHLRIS